MAVQELTPEAAQRLGFAEDEQAVLVARLERGSAAARAGLRPRDLIVEIDRKPVRSVDDYEEALENAGDRALMMVRRATRQGVRTDILAVRMPN
jgi:serine protease Do